jgi:hypothetical protein
MPELSFLTLPDIETLRQIGMAGTVAPTWPYIAMSGLCNFGDDISTTKLGVGITTWLGTSYNNAKPV